MIHIKLKAYSLVKERNALRFSNCKYTFSKVKLVDNELSTILRMIREHNYIETLTSITDNDAICSFLQVEIIRNNKDNDYGKTFIVEPSHVCRDLVIVLVTLIKEVYLHDYDDSGEFTDMIAWYVNKVKTCMEKR